MPKIGSTDKNWINQKDNFSLGSQKNEYLSIEYVDMFELFIYLINFLVIPANKNEDVIRLLAFEEKKTVS